jgi:hypothetical protein
VLSNGALARWRPRQAFRAQELLLVYGMLIVSCWWLMAGGLPFLAANTTYPFYMASPGNGWEHLLWPYLPDWLRLGSTAAVDWFWEGLPAGQAIPWAAWQRPAVAWGGFTLALAAALFCLGSLFRREWIERQRLTFPLLDIPLALTGPEGTSTVGRSLLANRIFWLGAWVPVTVSLVTWLHRFYPGLPHLTVDMLPVGRDLFLPMGLPWSSLSEVRVSLSWPLLGIMCLLPSEVTLSIWVFWALNKLQLLLWAAAGAGQGAAHEATSPTLFIAFEEAGGLLVLAGLLLWGARRTIARGLLGAAPDPDPLSPVSSRWAVRGLLAASLLLVLFAHAGGMSWWSAGLLLALFYAVCLVASRLVAASGLISVHTSLYGLERQMLLSLVGTRALGPGSLAMMSYLSGIYMNESPGDLALPHYVNSFKLAHAARIPGRALALAAALGAVVVVGLGLPALLVVIYHHGASGLSPWAFGTVPQISFRPLDEGLRSPQGPDPALWLATGIGACFMLGASWLHAQIGGLNPLGFVIADGWITNNYLWSAALLGWLVTAQIKRYGGLRLYRALRPAFIGLVLGSVLMDSVVGLADTLLGP